MTSLDDPETEPLTANQAERMLVGIDVVPALAGSLNDMKVMRDLCLAAGIPVMVGCPGGKSCGPNTHILTEESYAPRVAAVYRDKWRSELERQGLSSIAIDAAMNASAFSEGTDDEDADLPCPACGTAAPLIEGACSDCGLVLE